MIYRFCAGNGCPHCLSLVAYAKLLLLYVYIYWQVGVELSGRFERWQLSLNYYYLQLLNRILSQAKWFKSKLCKVNIEEEKYVITNHYSKYISSHIFPAFHKVLGFRNNSVPVTRKNSMTSTRKSLSSRLLSYINIENILYIIALQKMSYPHL